MYETTCLTRYNQSVGQNGAFLSKFGFWVKSYLTPCEPFNCLSLPYVCKGVPAVSLAAVLCLVTQRSSLGGALRDEIQNGCEGD